MLDRCIDELPTEAAHLSRSAWGAICAIGAEGRSFALSEIEARLTSGGAKAKSAVRKAISSFLASGRIARCDAGRAIGSRAAVYKLTDAGVAALEDVPQSPTFYTASLNLQIARTHDGLWTLMRWLDQNRGGFTASQVVRLVNGEIASQDVLAYLRALRRGGYIDASCGGADPLLRVIKRQFETPILRADGAPSANAARNALLWRAIKMNRYFTVREIAIAATIDAWPISDDTAARYCEALHAAGYLLRRGDVYRLAPGRNTGPAAPQVLRARFVWDPNLCRVIGDAFQVEERRV